jgi:hypothetical protein
VLPHAAPPGAVSCPINEDKDNRMTSNHRAASTDGTPEPARAESAAPPSDHRRALQWAQLILTAGGITGALTIWALNGPPLIAVAIATAAAGNAGWQITVNVRR